MEPDILYTVEEKIIRIVYRGRAQFDITTDMLREINRLGTESGIKSVLVDISEAVDPDYHVNAIRHVEQSPSLGVDASYRLAILSTENDERLPYIETVASNRGLQLKCFTDETDAIAWLLDQS